MVEFNVTQNENGQRLGRIISAKYGVPYDLLQKLFRLKKVNLNGEKSSIRTIVCMGDTVTIYANISEREASSNVSGSEAIKREKKFNAMRIYEDSACVAINKPSGLAVQPGSRVSICVEALMKSVKHSNFRLVHRLDKDTSGVLLIAKTLTSARRLTDAFRNNEAKKKYLAIVSGIPNQKSGVIKVHLKKTVISGEEKVVVVDEHDPEGSYSETRFNVIRRSGNRALVELYPSTGRTHQLRVHCAEVLGTPIVGDKKYGTERNEKHMLLHACNIKIEKLGIDVSADLPEYFRQATSTMSDINNQAHLVFLSKIIR